MAFRPFHTLPDLSHGGTLPGFLSPLYRFDRRRRRRHTTTIDEWVHTKVEEAQRATVDSELSLGPGDTGTPEHAPTAFPEREEVCWVDSRGDLACWLEGSIFAPGEIWGPPADEYERAPAESPVLADYEIIDPEGELDVFVAEPVQQSDTTEEEMAFEWTDVFAPIARGIAGSIFGDEPNVGNQFAGGGVAVPPPPRQVTVDTVTGEVKPCRRRRRRRLLTEGDFNDLMRIATLPSKQNVTVALAKAVGRR